MRIGDTFWWVTNNAQQGAYEVTVTKVARVYATLNNGCRVNIKTRITSLPGYHKPPGRIYYSKREHDEELKLTADWNQFREDVLLKYRPPAMATIEGVKAARKMLGV